MEDFQGEIPLDFETLKKMPGIGSTASALISIGDDQRALAVDANLEECYLAFMGYQLKRSETTKRIKEII